MHYMSYQFPFIVFTYLCVGILLIESQYCCKLHVLYTLDGSKQALNNRLTLASINKYTHLIFFIFYLVFFSLCNFLGRNVWKLSGILPLMLLKIHEHNSFYYRNLEKQVGNLLLTVQLTEWTDKKYLIKEWREK